MIEADALGGWLTEIGCDFEPPLRMRRIGHGKSNITILLEDDHHGHWVLRRAPYGSLLASAHDVTREARILGALAGTGVSAPRPLGLCEVEQVSDAPLLLMEFVEGTTVDTETAALGLTEQTRAAIGPALCAALASIHELDIEAAGLADLSSHGHYGRRQLKRWRRQWEATREGEAADVEGVAERLEAALPEQTETRLLHGDFHLLNCLIDPAGGVSAILDWELSTLGDPLADLGTLLAYWSAEGGHPIGGPYALTALPGFSAPDELVAAYAKRSGRDTGAVVFWQALAYWKVAIIVAGVNRRHRENPSNTSGLGAGAVERLVARANLTLDRL